MSEEFLVFLDEPDAVPEPKPKAKTAKKADANSEFVILLDEPKKEKNSEFVILLDSPEETGSAWAYSLPPRSSIENAQEIYAALKNALTAEETSYSIDASEVEYIDTAVLQMLAYFSEHFKQRGNRVSISKASNEFNACCTRLNFEKYLKLAA